VSWADRPDGEAAGDGGGRVGVRSQAVLDYVVKGIVDDPDAVVVEVDDGDGDGDGDEVTFRLHVSPTDMGRVIGRRGRTAQAIRRIVRAAGASEGVTATVDIVD
jgi:predicted RNA-binding protein YlqC (UPF0109 family)